MIIRLALAASVALPGVAYAQSASTPPAAPPSPSLTTIQTEITNLDALIAKLLQEVASLDQQMIALEAGNTASATPSAVASSLAPVAPHAAPPAPVTSSASKPPSAALASPKGVAASTAPVVQPTSTQTAPTAAASPKAQQQPAPSAAPAAAVPAAPTAAQVCSSIPTTKTLLPCGYLTTKGAAIVDQSGNPVRIDNIHSYVALGNLPNQTALALVTAGFNTLRLAWANATMQADLASADQVIAVAKQVGLKVIIDHHTDEGGPTACDGYGAQQKNGLWFDVGPGTNGTDGCNPGTVSAQKFRSDWIKVAQHYAGNDTVIAFDMDNEPHTGSGINWGQGGPTDLWQMYQTVGAAIQQVDPSALILCEGFQDYGSGAPEGDLRYVASKPVVLPVPNKVVYVVHEYPQSISGISPDSGPSVQQRYQNVWGYLISGGTAPVLIDEMGASLDGNDAGESVAGEQAWASTLIDYMNGPAMTATTGGQGVSGGWFCVGYVPGDQPDGILESDWVTVKPAQAQYIAQVTQKPIAVSAAAASNTPASSGAAYAAQVANVAASIAPAPAATAAAPQQALPNAPAAATAPTTTAQPLTEQQATAAGNADASAVMQAAAASVQQQVQARETP